MSTRHAEAESDAGLREIQLEQAEAFGTAE
jgi:hypothetical protein